MPVEIATTVIGRGQADRFLEPSELRDIVAEAIASAGLEGKRVLMLIPDGTRTMPMPQLFALFEELLRPQALALDYLVALGTHPPMTDEQLSKLIGRRIENGMAGAAHIFNHNWADPATFARLGVIPAAEVKQLTGGALAQDVPVDLNRLVLDYDHVLICGPVFPHEVVGFSGGNKYFFPGIAGPDIINLTHWLGALITSYEVIGSGYTPVRAVIDRAAALIPRPASCFAMVVMHEGVSGLYFGPARDAWQAAAELSARKHIQYVEEPFRRVLAVMPHLYDDIWTAAKGMYKTEPAIADGGEVIVYAPHITEISYTHGKLIDEIGYHCRDYFVKQWERFEKYPGGILAHSTHLKGLGTYDSATGIETSRIQVTLATGIPEERCRRVNLGYMDPASVLVDEWRDREEEGVLLVPRAGEVLYRLNQHRQSPTFGRLEDPGVQSTDY
jgi:nickel-dependent lactate racemase